MKREGFFFLVALVFLAFGGLCALLAVADPYHLIPIHIGLGAFMIVLLFFSGGVRSLLSGKFRRRVLFCGSVALYSSLFVAALAVINLLTERFLPFRYDSTHEGAFTLAPETEELLAGLPGQLTVRAFYFGGKIDDPKTEALLRRVDESSAKVDLEIIDPEKRPTLLETYEVSQSATVVLSVAEKKDPQKKDTVKLVGKLTEEDLANGLKKLLRTQTQKVYYLAGHGEPEVSSRLPVGYSLFKESIESERFSLVPVVLGPTAQIPEDAAAIILSAPRTPLSPAERAALVAYLYRGGNALLFNEVKGSDDVREIAASLGIDVGYNVVVDKDARAAAGAEMGVEPLVSKFGSHPITEKLGPSVFFSTASTVRAAKNAANTEVTPIALTSPESWAERDVDLVFSDDPRVRLDAGDERGPLSLAVAVEQRSAGSASAQGRGRAVVFGDADFASNRNLRQVYNRDLLLNSLNWVTGQEDGITIRPRALRASSVSFTLDQMGALFALTTIALPEGIVLAGLAIWARRKRLL